MDNKLTEDQILRQMEGTLDNGIDPDLSLIGESDNVEATLEKGDK
jgi:hypothetical protein